MKILFATIFFFLFSVKGAMAQSDTESFRLDNAYFLAKAICSPEKYADNEDKARQLLGGMLWYMSADGSKQLSDVKLDIQNYYTGLKTHFDKLVSPLQKEEQLLTLPYAVLENCIRSKIKQTDPNWDTLMKFLGNRREYDTLLKVEAENKKDVSKSRELRNYFNGLLNAAREELEEYKNEKIIEQKKIEAKIAEIEARKTDSVKYNDRHQKNISAEKNIEVNKRRLEKEIKAAGIFAMIPPECVLTVGLPGLHGADHFMESKLEEFQKNIRSELVIQQSEFSPLSFKLPSQSDIIDALAIYLAKRVKQESVMWFFENLQRSAKKHEMVTTFFPETISLLQSKEVYEVPNLGSAWRYALSKDFVFMPQSLFRSHWLKRRLGKDSTVITEGLNITWSIARMVEQQYNYNDIISSLYLQHQEPERSGSLSTNDLISFLYCINTEFIKRDVSMQQWLKYEDLLYLNDDELTVMISLVDAKYHGFFSKMLNIENGRFELAKQKLNQLRRWMGLVLLKINQIDKLKGEFKAFKAEAGGNPSKFEYSDYNSWRFMQDLLKTLQLSRGESSYTGLFKKQEPLIEKTLSAMVDVQEVYSLLQKKNFAGAMDIVLHIVDDLMKKDMYTINISELKARISDFKISSDLTMERLEQLGAQYATSTSVGEKKRMVKNEETVTFPDSSYLAFLWKRNDLKAIKIVRGIAGFLNDVAQADNSKTLSRVVESYALPVNSYKKKRNSWKSFDLAAYVGVYAGYEASATITKGKKHSGAVYGLSAPIGLSFSSTLGSKKISYSENDLENPDLVKVGRNNLWKRSGTTITIFASVIDIGAVVSYRFNNQDTVLPQKVKWAQVISPGLHLNVGIKGTPLVFSAGVQYTPQLRSFKQDELQRNVVRVYGGIFFDLPLFNFWTKSEMVKRK